MQRKALQHLQDWFNNPNRKPLVLRGARQVGKTWLVRTFAHNHHRELIELNFEKDKHLSHHFDSHDPDTILLNLESAFNQSINSDTSLLFLDEIQAAPEILATLRWFYENKPELPVIAAGSLLEFVLDDHSFSMPVGRINYCFIEPLGFEEFLQAQGQTHLLKALAKVHPQAPLNEALHQKASQLFKEFMMVGGLPQAVDTWINTHSMHAVSQVHHDLIHTYQDDFAKYAGRLSTQYLDDTFMAIPQLLTQKIMYSRIHSGARHYNIKQAVELLTQARLGHKVYHVHANGIPPGAEIKPRAFKMILVDVGLVSALLGIQWHQIKHLHDAMLINQGALTEQAIGQLLRLLKPYYQEPHLYYWARDSKASSAEIDYLEQYGHNLIPVEVKAGKEGKLRSLHQFMYEKHWPLACRFYDGPIRLQNIQTKTTQGHPVSYHLLSLPFYLIHRFYEFADLGLT